MRIGLLPTGTEAAEIAWEAPARSNHVVYDEATGVIVVGQLDVVHTALASQVTTPTFLSGVVTGQVQVPPLLVQAPIAPPTSQS